MNAKLPLEDYLQGSDNTEGIFLIEFSARTTKDIFAVQILNTLITNKVKVELNLNDEGEIELIKGSTDFIKTAYLIADQMMEVRNKVK